MTAPVYVIDPLADTRWDDLVARHPRATVFHTRGWLEALRRTYGYTPFVLTTTSGTGPLANGLVVCRVRTWLSRRLVSLPFSDHCDPLVDRDEHLAAMVERLRVELVEGGWRSVELRPAATAIEGLAPGARYCLHSLDLARGGDEVFRAFHPSHTQRAIRRAEREGLRHDSGNSESLLARFFALFRLTRRRHGVPPPPLAWFRNLVASLRERLVVHVASLGDTPVAALVMLTFGRTLVYKYGGSDAAQHRLGGMPFLFWQAIRDAQARGIEALDMGRSNLDQPGLIAFKDHLGATRSPLTYYGLPGRLRPSASARQATDTSVAAGLVRPTGLLAKAAKATLARLPDPLFDLSGRLAYRHMG